MNGKHAGESRPAWYGLSYLGASTIRLSVHRMAFDAMVKLDSAKAPAVKNYIDTYGLSSFTPPCEGQCGFQDVLTPVDIPEPDWIAWDAVLPIMKRDGKLIEESPKGDTLALRVTLNFFSAMLWFFDGDTGWKERQLMVIEDISLPVRGETRNHAGISMSLLPETAAWLLKNSDGDIPEVVTALKTATKHMWGRDDSGTFDATVLSGWLTMRVPGDACGLIASHTARIAEGRGYTIHGNNVDRSCQQLALLAGLAKLHDLVRADGV